MTRVDTDSDTAFIFYFVDDVSQMLKSKSHVRTLSGRIFDDGSNPKCLIESDVYRFGYPVEACIDRYFFQVGTGVEVEQGQSQLLTSLHFIEKGSPRFFQPFGLRVPQINKITVVR